MRKYLMFLLIGVGLLLISCNNPDSTTKDTTSSIGDQTSTSSVSIDKTSTTRIPSSNGTNNSFGTNIPGDVITDFPWEE